MKNFKSAILLLCSPVNLLKQAFNYYLETEAVFQLF